MNHPEKQDEPGTILRDTIAILEQKLPVSLDSLTLEKVVVGVFFTGVKLTNGYGGVCYTPVDLIPEAVCCTTAAGAMPFGGKLAGIRVSEMLQHLDSQAPLVRGVIISLINALSAWCQDLYPEQYHIQEDTDAFDQVQEINQDVPIIVVGALWPVIHRIQQQGNPYYIFELNPDALRPEEMSHYVPPEKNREVMAKAGCVILTGATLVTNTLEGLLSMVPPGIPVIIGGPTVSLIPDALFSRGVTAIGGIKVTNPDELLDAIMQGGSGYHFFGRSARKITLVKQTANPS